MKRRDDWEKEGRGEKVGKGGKAWEGKVKGRREGLMSLMEWK